MATLRLGKHLLMSCDFPLILCFPGWKSGCRQEGSRSTQGAAAQQRADPAQAPCCVPGDGAGDEGPRGGLPSSSMEMSPDCSAARVIWERHKLSLTPGRVPVLAWHSRVLAERVKSKQGQGGSACLQKSRPSLQPGIAIMGERQNLQRCILSRASLLCHGTREQRLATAWWGRWTGAAARRWRGGEPGKGVCWGLLPLRASRPPHASCTLSRLLCREAEFGAAEELREPKIVPDVGLCGLQGDRGWMSWVRGNIWVV